MTTNSLTCEGPSSLTETDQHALAAMHCRILPDSLVSRLGRSYAQTFYRYVANSAREFAFVENDNGELISACIVSIQPETLQKRLLWRTSLLLHVPFALPRLPLRSILKGLTGQTASRSKQPPGPEVLLIFTAQRARGRGLGASTLRRCENFLKRLGHDCVYVKTLDSPDNRAIQFYLREGFKQCDAFSKNGKRLVLFSKSL